MIAKLGLENFIDSLMETIKKVFRSFGIGVTTYANLVNLRERASDRSGRDFQFLIALDREGKQIPLKMFGSSHSQLRQDLFVISHFDYKENGYFVEFGATNGLDLSNTYLLEHKFSWTGILAEPAKVWHEDLQHNRPKAVIESLCVWKDSNSELVFNETQDPELSTVDAFSQVDGHKKARLSGTRYAVKTISLGDMLRKHNAPKHIDYLSIDTEGSEFEILDSFNFNEYSFGIITVEHNYTEQRDQLYRLLTKNGYKRIHEQISYFDDWYIKA